VLRVPVLVDRLFIFAAYRTKFPQLMKPGPAKALFPPSSGDSAGQSAIQARTVFVFVFIGSKKFGHISAVDRDLEPFGLVGSRS
jgi:hypothetical protein